MPASPPLNPTTLRLTATCLSSAGMSIPSGLMIGAVGVGDGEDLAPLLVEEPRGVAADVAVTLDGEGGPGDRLS